MMAHFLFTFALLAPAAASKLLLHSSTASLTETSAAMHEAQQVLASDTRFYISEFAGLEDQLTRLATAVEPNLTNKTAAAVPGVVKEHNKPAIVLNPKTAADLAPTLAMLEGLYEDGKRRIADLNEHEKKSKKDFEEKETKHKAKLAQVEARFANHTLSLEFRTNETRDEDRIWSYWSRVRERQHRQFHTGLKIQHATLSKVKNMIDMYEKTMSGKASEMKQAKKEFERMAPPEIVFLQERRAVVQFCEDSLTELRSAREELKEVPLPLIY